jgi:hypothetical protein
MPALLAGNPIGIVLRSRKDPLPCPISTGVWIFSLQSIRQYNPTESFLEIFLMLASICLDLFEEGFFDRRGQHCVPVFITFTSSNNDLIPRKIDIFDPKTAALHQSQTTTVQKNCHQTRQSRHVIDYVSDFVFRQHNRQPLRSPSPNHAVNQSNLFAQHLMVEEQ